MKRILTVLTVVLVMAALMVVMAAPAFAAPKGCAGNCQGQNNGNWGAFNNLSGDENNTGGPGKRNALGDLHN